MQGEYTLLLMFLMHSVKRVPNRNAFRLKDHHRPIAGRTVEHSDFFASLRVAHAVLIIKLKLYFSCAVWTGRNPINPPQRRDRLWGLFDVFHRTPFTRSSGNHNGACSGAWSLSMIVL